MRNATECRQVIHVFERRGMEFQEQRARTARPGTGRPGTSAAESRPLTVQCSSPFREHAATTTARPSPFSLPSVEAGSLSSIRSPSPKRPPNQDYESQHPVAASHEMPPPRLFTRDEFVAPRQIEPARPTTAQIYRSYTTPYQSSHYDACEFVRQSAEPAVPRPSSLSQNANLEAIRDAAAEHQTPPKPVSESLIVPTFAISQANEHWCSGTTNPTNPALHSSDRAEIRTAPEYSSTPETTAVPENLDYEISSCRKPHIPRPTSHRSASERSSSRPVTASLPPLPKPTIVKSGSVSPLKSSSASPAKEGSATRPATASPMKRPLDADEVPLSRQKLTEEVNTEGMFPTKPRSPVAPEKSPTSPAKRPSAMDELLARERPLTEKSTNVGVARLNSLADAPHEIVSPPHTAHPPSKSVSTSAPCDVAVRDFTAAIQSTMQNPEKLALNEYAAQSREDREATLDEFMVEHLETRDFTTLCEDVENCWRRIALGL